MIDEKEIGLFLTDKYRVLSIINQECYLVKNQYSSITQKEISRELGFNIMKVNEIIQELIKLNYLEKIPNHKGRYIVTSKAKKIINKIEYRGG